MAAMLANGLLLAFAGGLAIHLASPHQRWRQQALPARPARVAGSLLLLAAFLVLLRVQHALVAAFTLLTWLMLLWIALPYLGALRARPASPRKEP